MISATGGVEVWGIYKYIMSDLIYILKNASKIMNIKVISFIYTCYVFLIYISTGFNNVKTTNTPISELHNILNKLTDNLNIASFTIFDLLKVCMLYTDTTSLIFLRCKTSKTFQSPDQLSSFFFIKISMLSNIVDFFHCWKKCPSSTFMLH